MASKFLKNNFKSMTKSEKEKLEELNEYRKLVTGAAAGDKEVKAIAKSITDISILKKGNTSKIAELLKKQLEDEKK